MFRGLILSVSALAAAASGLGSATPSSDAEAIKQAALDYIEGWYAGDAARMERSIVRVPLGGMAHHLQNANAAKPDL